MKTELEGKNIKVYLEEGETVSIFSENSDQKIGLVNNQGMIKSNDQFYYTPAILECDYWFENFKKTLDIFIEKFKEINEKDPYNDVLITIDFLHERPFLSKYAFNHVSVNFRERDIVDHELKVIQNGPEMSFKDHDYLAEYLCARVIDYCYRKGIKVFERNYQAKDYYYTCIDSYSNPAKIENIREYFVNYLTDSINLKGHRRSYFSAVMYQNRHLKDSDWKCAENVRHIYQQIALAYDCGLENADFIIQRYRDRALTQLTMEEAPEDLVKQSDESAKIYQKVLNEIKSL